MICEYVVQRVAANLPQSTTATLFTVSGSYVLLVGLVGEVTTAIGANVTVSVLIGGQTPWSSGLTSSDVAGQILGYQDTDLSSLPSGSANVPIPRHPMVLANGATIRLQTSASVTGQIKWTALYDALLPGATLVAA